MRVVMPTAAATWCNVARRADKGLAAAGRRYQEVFDLRRRIVGTQRAETRDELAHEGIRGDPRFRLELAERYENGPLVGAEEAQAIEG